MQSSFKSPPPSFIEEIQRELRATTMHAEHIIFMGYSLPPDDVGYRALFAATCQRGKKQSERVRCTIVNQADENPGWYGPQRLAEIKPGKARDTVEAAIDVFDVENVRFYGGGVPEIFLDNGLVSEHRLEELLDWTKSLRA